MEEQVVAVAAPDTAVAPEPAPVIASFLKAAGASAAEWTALVGVIGEVNRLPDLAYISAPEFAKALEDVRWEGKALPLTVKARLRGVKQAVTVPTSQMGHKRKLSAVLDQAAEGHSGWFPANGPYAAFSIFGPHGDRLTKKLKFASYTFTPDGSWTRSELPGPPDFPTWWRCYRTYKTLLLLLDLVDVEPLDNYGEKVRDHMCWMEVSRGWWPLFPALQGLTESA
eukprot:5321903-Amphidinium_carterae.2